MCTYLMMPAENTKQGLKKYYNSMTKKAMTTKHVLKNNKTSKCNLHSLESVKIKLETNICARQNCKKSRFGKGVYL